MESMGYKKDELVKYRARFLRSVSWYTNVPVDGRVTEDQKTGDRLVKVQWCDSDTSSAVADSNIMPANAPDYT